METNIYSINMNMKKNSKPPSKKKSEDISILTPEEYIALKPLLATKAAPDFSDAGDNAEQLDIRLNEQHEIISVSPKDNASASISKEKNTWRIHIKCKKDRLHSGQMGKTHEWLSQTELAGLTARVKAPASYRPEWLDQLYAPQVIPHRKPGVDWSFLKKSGGLIHPAKLLRLELTSYFTFPWCTIGKVFCGYDNNFNSVVKTGTGVMVGRNLLLTASHVAPWDRGPGKWWMRFVPAYKDGTAPFGSSYVEHFRGVRNIDDVTGLDHIICKLYTPLGDNTGWMGSQSFGDDDNYYNGNWTSVGYPDNFFNGQRPAVEYNLKIEDVDNDGDGRELETHVFSSPGWSGGPLWGWINNSPKVIGVMSGNEEEFAFEEHSVSAGGLSMVNLIKFGLNNWKI